MAAIDLTAVSAFPHFVTTASVGTNAQEYKLPDYCTMVSMVEQPPHGSRKMAHLTERQ